MSLAAPIRPKKRKDPSHPSAPRNGLFRYLVLCAQETRYAVQIIFLLRFTVAGTTGLTSILSLPSTLAPGAAVWLCCVAFTYLYNGISDIGEDRANGSTRPIARGALPVPVARRVC